MVTAIGVSGAGGREGGWGGSGFRARGVAGGGGSGGWMKGMEMEGRKEGRRRRMEG